MVAGVVRPAQQNRREREKKRTGEGNDAKAAAILNSVLKQEAALSGEIPSFANVYQALRDKDVYFVTQGLSGAKCGARNGRPAGGICGFKHRGRAFCRSAGKAALAFET